MQPGIGDAFACANQYYSTGQYAAAEQMFRNVLELDPHHAGALHALGRIAYRKRGLNEAASFLRAATASDPANAEYWNDLGAVCSKIGSFREAAAACEEALRLRPDFAYACNNLGYALLYLNDNVRAVTVLQQAIRLSPEMADAHTNLGMALKALDRMEEAARELEIALTLNPGSAELANMAGMVAQREGNIERAMEHYRHAVRVKPDYADPLNNLATCYKEQGCLDEAVTYFREALRVNPSHIISYYNLSELAADGRFTFQPEELDRLRKYLATETASPLWRSVAGVTLAAVLDARAAYDEAFAYCAQAAELRRDWLRENNRLFDPQRHCALIDAVISTFNGAYFGRIREWGSDSDVLIFIVGMPRSGTTLVEQILSSHPRVYGAGECGEFPRIVASLTHKTTGAELATPVPFPDRSTAEAAAERYLGRINRLAKGAAPSPLPLSPEYGGEGVARVTDKTLENFVYLGLLATVFPRARVIYCRRGPRDVCLSCFFHNFEMIDYSWSLTDLGVYYRQYERLMEHWKQVLPIAIHEVTYEDLLVDQEHVTRELLAACGLDWDERCLSFQRARRAVQTSSAIQVRRPLSMKSVGRWKNYRSYLGPLLEALQDSAGPYSAQA